MLKKFTIFFMILMVMGFISVTFGKVEHKQQLLKIDDYRYNYQEGLIKHRLRVLPNARGRAVVIDTMSWYTTNPAWLNAGLPYPFPLDTVIQDFKLIPDPAYLLKVRGLFDDGGMADFFVWEGDSMGNLGFPGTVLDNRPWDVQGGGISFEELDFTPAPDTLFLPWSNDPDPANRPFFVIGYACSGNEFVQGGGVPDIYYDYNETYSYWNGPNSHSWFTYNRDATCGPNENELCWSGVIYYDGEFIPENYTYWAQYVFEVVVVYYNGTSPFINSLSQAPNTWATSNFSSITSEIVDIDGSVANTWLFYRTQSSANPDSVTGTPSEGNIYTFDIPGTYNVGDSISYWTKAVDNDGKSIVGTITRSFVIKEPQNPNAEVLVVHDNLIADEADLPLFYEPILNAVINDSLGMEYEIWNVQDNHGIDNSITDYASYNTALIFGYGVDNVPALDYSNSVWENFVEAGKNIFICSADWLYANGFDVGEEYTPVDGDFLKDIMGVGWVQSDPNDGSPDPGPYSQGEPWVIGVNNDPISAPWFATPLIFEFGILLDSVSTTGNWNDYAEKDATNPNAATVFSGINFGRGNGVRNTNSFGGKTLYLPFSFGAIVDTTDQGDIILTDAIKLLKQYFDYSSAVGIDEPSMGTPLTYELRPNYPNPFNPSTTITYSIQKAGLVKLTVYNPLGEKVRTLVNTTQSPDVYHISWDGKNDAGINVASGVYIYKLSAGDFSDSHKMILMK